jgi:hypothetical protein
VTIKISRKSGPVCRGSDTEDIQRAVTGSDTGAEVWPGVTPGATSLQLVAQYEEVSKSPLGDSW